MRNFNIGSKKDFEPKLYEKFTVSGIEGVFKAVKYKKTSIPCQLCVF